MILYWEGHLSFTDPFCASLGMNPEVQVRNKPGVAPGMPQKLTE